MGAPEAEAPGLRGVAEAQLQALLAAAPEQRPELVHGWRDGCSLTLLLALLGQAETEAARRGPLAALALAEVAVEVGVCLDPRRHPTRQRREAVALAYLHVGWWQSLAGDGEAARHTLRRVLADHRRQPLSSATQLFLYTLLASVEAWAGFSRLAWDYLNRARSAGFRATGGDPGHFLEPLLAGAQLGELVLRLRCEGGPPEVVLERVEQALEGAPPGLWPPAIHAAGWALIAADEPQAVRKLLRGAARSRCALVLRSPWLVWLEGRLLSLEGQPGAGPMLAQAQRDLAAAGAPFESALALLNRLAAEPRGRSLGLAAGCAAAASALAFVPAAAEACWHLGRRVAAGTLTRAELASQAQRVLAQERRSGQVLPLYGPFWRL